MEPTPENTRVVIHNIVNNGGGMKLDELINTVCRILPAYSIDVLDLVHKMAANGELVRVSIIIPGLILAENAYYFILPAGSKVST